MAIAHRKFVSAVVLLTAAALAGCSAQPGTAAVINGTKITEGELDDATLEFGDLTGQPPQPSVVLNTLLAAEVFPSIAAEHGLALSDQQVTQRLEEQAVLQGAEVPVDGYSPAFIDLGHYLFSATDAQAHPEAAAIFQEFTTAMGEADIEVNPRYGQVEDSGEIVPSQHDWLVTPDAG
ncbi:hypothetical protein FE374_04170 [Georgenia yuyongxinii]|uniref:Uncharacterized protein n=1 Tax=Georgenia yuyongxinii TaxID=2589797 RepID=A0A5B8C1G8_9MICO|nr:hypothetical protein [Georgenia yuyongxinii]QDC23937.1 hypothetical protein FE374_04170 [Georgenia yuyongxinii]